MHEFFNTYFQINPETGLVDLNAIVIITLIVAGFLVGVINTIAGSGTVITYSLFMMLGLPANLANGTIRLGVIMQTLASSTTFYLNGKLPVKRGLLLSIPVLIGTVAGASIATHINTQVFERILGVIFLAMLFFIFYNPDKWIKEQIEKTTSGFKLSHFLIFLAIGFYGGFIHIGVGVFLLSALVLSAGYDLVKANALKVFIVFVYSPVALAIYLMNDQVNLTYGLIAAIGNVIGGIVASKMAIKRGARFVQYVLAVVMVLFSIKLLFY